MSVIQKEMLKVPLILVKSSAIKNNNSELRYARKKNSNLFKTEILADVVSLKKYYYYSSWQNNYNFFSFKILSDQKLDPTIINGGELTHLRVMQN